jgi:hypothetical protein
MDVGLCCVSCVLNLYCVELHIFEVILDNTDVLCALVYDNQTRFWIIRWVLDIRGFGFGSEFSPELIFGLDLSFRFGLWVRMPSQYIRSESDPLPSLYISATVSLLVISQRCQKMFAPFLSYIESS